MSTPRQRLILHESGRWDVVELLTEPDAAITRAKARQAGDTGFEVDGDRYHRQDTGKGIELRTAIGGEAVEVVTWATIKTISSEVPDDLRAALADHRLRSRLHQQNYPVFAASRAAQGCGAPWSWVRPLTEGQALYEAEYDAYRTGLWAAWNAKRKWLDDECDLLLAAALLTPDAPPAQEGLW